MDFSKLKSGTDIRGVASENDLQEPVTLTEPVIQAIASAFLVWCETHLNKPAHTLRLAVGHDSRISAGAISFGLKKAFLRAGAHTFFCGLTSTPSMFMATLELPCDCAVEITASHHPFHRNGLKFFTQEGGLDAPDISEILQLAQEGRTPPEAPGGVWAPYDYRSLYAQGLRDMICKGVQGDPFDKPLAGLHIVVDAGNGAGGFYATQVLEPLGATISGSQFLEPDGLFPNHIPNPEDSTAMESVCKATVEAKADLGIIFDTDVDRSGAVDRDGKEINRNRLVALASVLALEDNPGGTIVTDSTTSDGLKVFLEDHLGGKHFRFKRGYKNVINQAIALNKEGVNCPLAIETSGHAAMRENHFLDDGAYLVTKLIIKLAILRREGKVLSHLLSSLQEPAEAMERRIPITDPDFSATGNRLIQALEAHAKAQGWRIAPDNREGLRVSFPAGEGDGWFLLRLSVHDPILPINVESNSPGGCAIIWGKLRDFLAAHAQGLGAIG